MKYPLILCTSFLLLAGCKQKDLCKMDLPPNVFYFIVHENGQPLSDSLNDRLRLFYLDGNSKVYRPPPNIFDTTFIFPARRHSGNLANSKVRVGAYIYSSSIWYLEHGNGDVDTINISYMELKCEDAKKDRCYCYKPFTRVQFNGHDAPEYTQGKTADNKIIFLFNK